ncbi:unnamed protein product [Caenorhabditis bovis]|uniref:Uncharacterized protein n=1 Tax=Caenorhabditis bovis TaxID=2654633 RepID=A0A8S1EGJ7_9PELO|nr:unnamed protein product [Caenorhabditis bovis]
MPKKYLIDGRFLVEDMQEGNFDDIRERFKENVTVDDLESWENRFEVAQLVELFLPICTSSCWSFVEAL